MVASANGINHGAESARMKTEDRQARTRGGEGGQPRTGRVVLLPDENPAEFRERMTGLFDSLRPRNQFEISLVERAFFVSWRLDRFVRAVGSAVPEGPHSRHRRTESRGGGGWRADDTIVAGTFWTTRCASIRQTTRR